MNVRSKTMATAAWLTVLTSIAAAQPAPEGGIIHIPAPSRGGPATPLAWRPGTDQVEPLPHPPLSQIEPAPMPQPDDVLDSVAGPATMRIVDAEAGTVEDVPLSTRPLPPEAHSQLPFIGLGDVMAPLEWQRGFSDMQLVSGAELNSYPARANCKIAMRFLDPNGNDIFSSCSGSMQDTGVVLVAAHCLYMRETKSGTPIYRYAEEVWVYPAWDGTDLPLRSSTLTYDNYGAARSTHFIVGSDYVDDGNFNRDVGIIRLDRTETRNVGILCTSSPARSTTARSPATRCATTPTQAASPPGGAVRAAAQSTTSTMARDTPPPSHPTAIADPRSSSA
ncbi:MAG: hypothetical protein NTV94_00715 [Planctomycetota bacterium]|nr:hypothetical protein [Planctomycetota bacterium]